MRCVDSYILLGNGEIILFGRWWLVVTSSTAIIYYSAKEQVGIGIIYTREYSEKSRNNSQKRILQFNYAKSGRVRRKTTQIIIPRALARTFLLSTLPTKITENLLSTQGELRMNESC